MSATAVRPDVAHGEDSADFRFGHADGFYDGWSAAMNLVFGEVDSMAQDDSAREDALREAQKVSGWADDKQHRPMPEGAKSDE